MFIGQGNLNIVSVIIKTIKCLEFKVCLKEIEGILSKGKKGVNFYTGIQRIFSRREGKFAVPLFSILLRWLLIEYRR